MFTSPINTLGPVDLPVFTGTRVMMMPFRTDDVFGTLPSGNLRRWIHVIVNMTAGAPAGVGYLTIDEALVREGETHRRPGLHVDGVGPDGRAGGWGGGGGYAASGMTMVASHTGCRAWRQEFYCGDPGPDGDCAHLAGELDDRLAIDLMPNQIYLCSPMTVHMALPMRAHSNRQFCRVSFPSNAPWYEGYTENPLGVKPAGPVHPRRAKEMEFRP